MPVTPDSLIADIESLTLLGRSLQKEIGVSEIYELCIAVDRIMRNLSDKYRRHVEDIDAQHDLGLKILELPAPLRKMLERWFNL